MPATDSLIVSLAVALGIGLLIGAERERRKGEGQSRAPAGIRTFAIGSLAGAISFIVGGQLLLSIVTTGVFALTALGYWRGSAEDPGLTSEIALIVTVLLGGLSVQTPVLAAGLGVTLAILLAARSPLHYFVRSVLTQSEMTDALIFAGATLVILPLLPNRDLGPYGAFNPYKIWICGDPRHGGQRGGLCCDPLGGVSLWTPDRWFGIRVHLQHRDDRHNGSADREQPGAA
jgi:hypothetical protein